MLYVNVLSDGLLSLKLLKLHDFNAWPRIRRPKKRHKETRVEARTPFGGRAGDDLCRFVFRS